MSTSLYQVVVDHIEQGIKAGVYPPGSWLPTIARLAELNEVSQSTVKIALVLLNQRGVVVGQQGKGTRVANDADRLVG